MATTILFADDQIPDPAIPDDELAATLTPLYPKAPSGFIAAFKPMRKAVETLRDATYDVTIARTHQHALELIEQTRFDIAIVDLGWYADNDLPPDEQSTAGYKICEAIEKVNAGSLSEPTLIIMYSNRFATDASISLQAADHGRLPVFKNYEAPTHQALRASVKFIETHLKSASATEQLAIKEASSIHKALIDSLNAPLDQLKRWSTLTMVFIALSLLLLLVGAYFVIVLQRDIVGVLTSTSSLLSAAISTLLFSQLRKTEKSFQDNLKTIREERERAMERLYSSTAK